jgi:hypothetical protein
MPVLAKLFQHPVVAILLGAWLFGIPAVLNGFPFIFPDSGDYLVLHPLLYRSPYYGLLITFFHWNRFIWLPIVMQCVVVSHLLWLLTRLVMGHPSPKSFLLLAGLLTAFSSLPFFTGFIMADIFTPVMFLIMYIIGFHYRSLPRQLLVYLFVLNCIATAAHISNLTLGIFLLVLFAFIVLITSKHSREHFKPLAVLTAPIAATAGAILLFNVVIFNSWSLSPAGQSFILANMIQYGPARHYLTDSCPGAGYRICTYLNQLPETANELLWSSGMYEKLGGFAGMQHEAKEIVTRTIQTRPLEVFELVLRNFATGLATHEPAAEFRPDYQVPAFPNLIDLKFGNRAAAAYKASAEMRDAIPHRLIKAIDDVTFPAAGFVVIAFTFAGRKRLAPETIALSIAVVGFVLADTLLCTAVSGVFDRYQARVTWLVVCVALLLLLVQFSPERASRGTQSSGDLKPKPRRDA